MEMKRIKMKMKDNVLIVIAIAIVGIKTSTILFIGDYDEMISEEG